MEVRQISVCGLVAARCFSCVTTSTTETGLGGGGEVGTAAAFATGTVVGVRVASLLPTPSFSSIW